jgi:hypothetical protein
MSSIWENLEKKYMSGKKASVKKAKVNRIPTSDQIFHVHSKMDFTAKGISGDS